MNKLEKPLQNDVAGPRARHKTTQVMVGNVAVGGGAPIVVQSMTNTDTADVESTVAQVAALARAGSELVRITVDRDEPPPPCRISATPCASAASPRP